jgi:hypothetical protein
MIYEGMKKAAARTGWKLEPATVLEAVLTYSPMTLFGEESGVPMLLERNGSFHTFATNGYFAPPLPFSFSITSEGATGAIAHLLGLHDVEIGDAEFDRAFRLVSKDPAELKRVLTPAVRAVLQELASESRGFGSRFQVTEKVVSLTRGHFGLMTEEETLQDIPVVHRVVRVIQEVTQGAYR